MKRLPEDWIGVVVSADTLKSVKIVDRCMDLLGLIRHRCQIDPQFLNLKEAIASVKSGWVLHDDILYGMARHSNIQYEDSIFGLLNAIAPEGSCFRSHHSDGVLFGFWLKTKEYE